VSWLRSALALAADGRAKIIAGEAFPQMNDAAALAELGKYLNGERGESAFRVVEAICKLGHRDVLRAEIDERLREVNAGQLVDAVHQVQAQLELFGAVVRVLGERVEEVAQILPLRRTPGG
jgi:hypothetical protein